MITKKQQKWLDHLQDDDLVVIRPYDPSAPRVFRAVKNKIRRALGKQIRVEHRGATSYKISGQDEIDVYLPVIPEKFDLTVQALMLLFGSPKSCYPLERARFPISEQGKHVDVFVINEQHRGWVDSEIFDQYLRFHPKALEEYRQLKENLSGVSTRVYYTKKIEFINDILEKAKVEEGRREF